MPIHIATFNINSIRARLPNFIDWLKEAQPDIVFLQEIKTEEVNFPFLELQSAGYSSIVHGQKSYNGVAILSKKPLTLISTSLLADDPQARYIEALYENITLINVYVPNGNPVDSEKYPYKQAWLQALIARAQTLLQQERPFLIGGDFNLIPAPIDCHDPAAWEGDALYRPESRALWRQFIHLGLTDAFRTLYPAITHAYSFWDYQAGCWPRDAGIRIDHFLLSPQLADKLEGCQIDKAPRGQEKASDHTPVILSIRSEA